MNILISKMFQPEQKFVIPAWMPESSHRDVEAMSGTAPCNAAAVSESYHSWHWIPAFLPV
jgi:hypothetical protein